MFVNRHPRDPQHFRDLHNRRRRYGKQQLPRGLPPFGRDRWSTADMLSSFACRRDPGVGPLYDRLALELCQRGHDMKE